MTHLIQPVQAPDEIVGAAVQMRQQVLDREVTPHEVMSVFEAWAASMDAREMNDIPGLLFLRMWLKRGNLEPIIERELGAGALNGRWTEYGRAHCKAFP